MKRALISLGAAFAVTFSIWLTIVLFAPSLYVETAFVIVVSPLIAAGVITAFALWAQARK